MDWHQSPHRGVEDSWSIETLDKKAFACSYLDDSSLDSRRINSFDSFCFKVALKLLQRFKNCCIFSFLESMFNCFEDCFLCKCQQYRCLMRRLKYHQKQKQIFILAVCINVSFQDVASTLYISVVCWSLYHSKTSQNMTFVGQRDDSCAPVLFHQSIPPDIKQKPRHIFDVLHSLHVKLTVNQCHLFAVDYYLAVWQLISSSFFFWLSADCALADIYTSCAPSWEYCPCRVRFLFQLLGSDF